MSTDSSQGHPDRTDAAPESAARLEKLTEVIARSQHGYRELIDNLDQALFTLSLRGDVRVANLRLAQLLGVSFQELVGHSLTEFIDSPTLEEAARALPKLIQQGSWTGTISVRLRRDKEVRHLSCWLQTVTENGEVTSVTGWARDVTRQHEAEVRFADLFESLREGILFATPEGQLLDANPALVQMLGYESKEELQKRKVGEIYADPADRVALIRELEQKTSVHERPVDLRRKDGKVLHCLTSGFAIRDASGRPVRLQGIIVDVTERREIEKRLHEEQEFRRRLLADFPDLITVLDREGRITFVSEKSRDLLGRAPEEYTGKQIGGSGNERDRARLQAMVRGILNGETIRDQVEFEAHHTDGSLRTLLAKASPFYDEAGTISGVVISARDVTEARQIERQLHKEQEFARRLVECFPHLIVAFDREGRFTFVSERVRDVLGVSPEEYIGKSMGQRIDDENQREVTEMFRDIISGRRRQMQIEIQARHADGSLRSMQINASPLFGEDGEIVGMVSSGQDVTESRRIEQQLAQKEKFAAMGQMMVGAAHELNNPLTAILGVADLLHERTADDVTRRQIDLVLKQARRAATIVQNLLAFSRPVTLGRTKLRVADVVKEALLLESGSLEQKKIRVTFDASPDLPSIEGDRKLLKEVFLNIISNAEQAISGVRDHGTLAVKLSRTGECVRVTFADDGVGVPAESIGKIFDPFFTTKRPGGSSGLGLTICLAVVKEHGGRIEVESAPETGTQVHVLLPMAVEAPAAAAQSDSGAPAKSAPSGSTVLKGHSVLIVDDEESIREIIQEGLTARGMRAEAVGSSEAAISYLASRPCDVVLCDFNLPGINGSQLFERMEAQNPGTMPRFVFMTGDLLDPAAADRYRQKGAAILQKPFHVSALATLLAEILRPQPTHAS
ncbi:MAG TPA: PAS domain S-box protein [Verrucomicrobiae bacterium]|nr:PAS domain S-box protein [Verrucomicrobiae bacterium]